MTRFAVGMTMMIVIAAQAAAAEQEKASAEDMAVQIKTLEQLLPVKGRCCNLSHVHETSEIPDRNDYQRVRMDRLIVYETLAVLAAFFAGFLLCF